MANFDLDAAIDGLMEDVSSLSDHGRAAVFGACGEAMLPLLGEVERRTAQRWTFPEARPALDIVFGFVTNGSGPSEHPDLRSALARSAPHGNDLDSPWSTYAQDAITCIDAALVASSGNGGDFRPQWIQFSLEPLVVSLAARGYDVEIDPVPPGESSSQMEVDAAVDFLRDAIDRVSGSDAISVAEYRLLIRDARVLVPPFADS